MSLLRNFSPGGSEPDDDQPPAAEQPDETAPPGGGHTPGTARYAFAAPAASATPAHPTVPSEVVTDPDDPGEPDDLEDETAAPAAGARGPVLTPPDVAAGGAQQAPPFETSSPETAAPETASVPLRPATPAPVPSPQATGEGERPAQPATAAEPDFAAPLLRDAAELCARWQRVQGDFVDDPRAAVSDAADLVGQTVEALMEALRQRQRQLRTAWERGAADGSPTVATAPGGPDTEELRLMMQRYRALFNQLCRPS